jgi:1,4-alpha-glucan branching enzyme
VSPPLPSNSPAAPEYVGMGAIPNDDGVTFRAWTKFETSVAVAGDFKSWSATEIPLLRNG